MQLVKADTHTVGERTALDPTALIRGSNISIGNDCTIGAGVRIFCPGGFSLGNCGYIAAGVTIECWRFTAGTYLRMCERSEVGRGGCLSSEDSVVELGDDVQVNADVVINPNCEVKIGSHVGLGAGVGIWTHGAWLAGQGSKFAPVTIGDRVWLTGRSQVLPGVTIGDDCVVGMLSLVNRDLPARCLAGGVPCKVIKRKCYPRKDPNLRAKVAGLYDEWLASLAWRGIPGPDPAGGYGVAGVRACLPGTVFNLESLTTCGCAECDAAGPDLPDITEDFRDFIRRRGYRILTGKPFRSIPHPNVARWRDVP